MNKKLLFEGILLILIFGSIWGIFTLFPIRTGKGVIQLSYEKEQKLGDLLLKSVLMTPDFNKIENDTASAAIDVIMKRLLVGDSSHYSYTITLVDNDIANAFALPGGHILVTTGLIALLETPEECAAVIAHEIGHIEERHTVSKLLANFTLSLLLSDDALASQAADLIISSAYSRKQEEEADKFGLSLLEKSGIHPYCMGTAFRHLKDSTGAEPSVMEIIRSHPDIDSRIKAAYDYKVKEGFKEDKLDINWSKVQHQFIHPKSQ